MREYCLELQKVIVSEYEDEKEELKELLETVHKLSLTAELWHVGNKTVYVCLTGHFF